MQDLNRFFRRIAQHGSRFDSHHKKRRCFRGDSKDVLFAGLTQLESAGRLRQFPVSNNHQGLRQQFDYPKVLRAGRQVAGFGEKVIAQQHSFFHAPDFVHSRSAPTHKRIVDCIIMH